MAMRWICPHACREAGFPVSARSITAEGGASGPASTVGALAPSQIQWGEAVEDDGLDQQILLPNIGSLGAGLVEQRSAIHHSTAFHGDPKYHLLSVN